MRLVEPDTVREAICLGRNKTGEEKDWGVMKGRATHYPFTSTLHLVGFFGH